MNVLKLQVYSERTPALLSSVICVIAGAGHILTQPGTAGCWAKKDAQNTDCPYLTGLVYSSHHMRACGSACMVHHK